MSLLRKLWLLISESKDEREHREWVEETLTIGGGIVVTNATPTPEPDEAPKRSRRPTYCRPKERKMKGSFRHIPKQNPPAGP